MRGLQQAALALTVSLLAVMSAGCSESPSTTDVVVTATNTQVGRAIFHLRCQPEGGDVPDPKRACAALADEPGLVRSPKPFVCWGGTASWWEVTVRGRFQGRPIDVKTSTCWTSQMALIDKLGLARELESHLVARVPLPISSLHRPQRPRPASRSSAHTLSPPLAWVPNGPVAGVVRVGEKLVLGGTFTRIGPRTGPVVAVAPSGRRLPGMPEFAGGDVNAVVEDGHGGLFVGGSFRWAGGLRRSGLAHVLANGRVDARFDPRVLSREGQFAYPGTVGTLALGGDRLYVGGSFTEIGGLRRSALAAVDASSGSVSSWNPRPDSSYVYAIAADRSTVLVAGGFARIGGAARRGVAALDASSGEATGWNPAPDARVRALVVRDGVVYLGGDFQHIGGSARHYLAAVDEQTGDTLHWEPTVPASVSALAADGRTVWAGLAVESDTGLEVRQARPAVFAFSRSGDASTRWSLASTGTVNALASDGRTLYVGGDFQRSFAGSARPGAAAVDAESGALSSWNPELDLFTHNDESRYGVHALAIGSEGVVVGGDFASVGGASHVGLAAVDPRTGKPAPWDPRVDGSVSGIAKTRERIYFAGSFSHVAGRARNGAAAVDDRLALVPWKPPPLDPPWSDSNVTVIGGKIVLTGFFNEVSPGRGHGTLAAFDARTGRLLDWGPPELGAAGISRVLTGNGRVYAAGIDGTSATVAVLNPETGLVERYLFDNKGTGDVYAIALRGRTLYVGGAVQEINGRPRTRLAAVDAITGKLLPWQQPVDDSIFSMALVGDTLYIGGQFRHVGGKSRHGVAALDARTGRVLDWDPQLGGNVDRVGRIGSRVYVTGRFVSVGASAQPYLLFATSPSRVNRCL